MIEVSVVVPTYQRNDLLLRCLAALATQSYDLTRYEIIVADDDASDETRRLVKQWAGQAQVCVRYVPVTHAHGPAAARNAGWRAARGAIVAFTDDDCIPDVDWLRAGTAAFEKEVAGVWGRIKMPLPAEPTDYERDAAQLQEAEFATANCFYRRDALAAVGGFDERFTMAWREDSDLFFSLMERGFKLGRADQAVVTHPLRPAYWGVSVAQQRKSMFNALLYKKHPQLYRERIQPAPPVQYYFSIVALVIAVAGVLTLDPWMAGSGTIAWALVTAGFCAWRLRDTSRSARHIAEMITTSALIPPLAVWWRVCGAFRFRVWFL